MSVVGLIGIDCATLPEKTGLALGEMRQDGLHILETTKGPKGFDDAKEHPIAVQVADWMKNYDRALVAIDSPLGWPEAMSRLLAGHQAGQYMPSIANALFRRETDRVIERRIGKRPMDVGADRIARTALTALRILYDLRNLTKHAIPLVWQAQFPFTLGTIEVYPAGTLNACGYRSTGYKGRHQHAEREALFGCLQEHMQFEHEINVSEDPDILEALVCVLAAHDFMTRPVISPADGPQARKEGWIWVREPN